MARIGMNPPIIFSRLDAGVDHILEILMPDLMVNRSVVYVTSENITPSAEPGRLVCRWSLGTFLQISYIYSR